MKEMDDAVAKATAEANGVFEKMRVAVEDSVKRGTSFIDVVDVAKRAGLEIDEKILDELQIDKRIYPHPWLPWHFWWPWRPLWCWWWHQYHPWYRCCPWWWSRCHWYPSSH